MSQEQRPDAGPDGSADTGSRPAGAQQPVAQPHLPQPSVFPVTLAAGITLLLTGLLYGVIFVAAGLVLIAIALRGWISEVNR